MSVTTFAATKRRARARLGGDADSGACDSVALRLGVGDKL